MTKFLTEIKTREHTLRDVKNEGKTRQVIGTSDQFLRVSSLTREVYENRTHIKKAEILMKMQEIDVTKELKTT